MHLVSSSFEGGKRVGQAQAAVHVPVPVEADLFIRRLVRASRLKNFFANEADERPHAAWYRVTDRIADHDGPRARLNRRRVEFLHHFRPRPRRVFRDEHRRQAELAHALDGLLRGFQQEVKRSILGVLADGA